MPPPMTENKPKAPNEFDVPIEWVTSEEAEKFNKILYKNFVRKKEMKSGEREKFFYRVTGLCPYVPLHHMGAEVLASVNQNLVEFTVDKFHRREFITAKRRESGQEIEEEVNKPVTRHAFDDKSGTWMLVDSDTGFKMEARKFLDLFERDKD